jgi:indole-3-glycerol phosphate synthase
LPEIIRYWLCIEPLRHVTERLRHTGATLVAGSGVKSVDDAKRLRDAGADAALVGEATMREPTLVAEISGLP